MTERLDIFRVLDAAKAKDRGFFSKLTPDEIKAFQPFLVMRWMSGTGNASQIIMINRFLNPFVFALANEKELLWDLITVCNSGKKQRYTWLKLPTKKDPSRPISTQAVMQYTGYSSRDAIEALRILTRDDVLEMAEDLGWQKEEIAKIKKEMKGSEDVPESKPKAKSKAATADIFEY
jgi:hypothetical protein